MSSTPTGSRSSRLPNERRHRETGFSQAFNSDNNTGFTSLHVHTLPFTIEDFPHITFLNDKLLGDISKPTRTGLIDQHLAELRLQRSGFNNDGQMRAIKRGLLGGLHLQPLLYAHLTTFLYVIMVRHGGGVSRSGGGRCDLEVAILLRQQCLVEQNAILCAFL